MSRTLLSAMMTAALLFAASALGAPKLPQADPQWYLRQDTWQETVRQSREALARYRESNPDSVPPGAPEGVTFGPWHAIGPFAPPAGKDGFDFAYPPEEEVDFSKRYDGHGWKRNHLPDGYWHPDIDLPDYSSWYLFRTMTAEAPTKVTVYIGCDDRAKVWLNGKKLLTIMHPSTGTGVELPLTLGENRLLVKVYNVTGGKAYSFSLTPNTKSGRPEDVGPEEILWALVARDFHNPADQRQIRWEREDTIWDLDWPAGGFRDLAQRYAAATRKQETLDAKATELAGKTADASGLDSIREVYYRSRTIEETAARIGALDFAPLRRAITDLTASFGARYPLGQDYLTRLEGLEKLREAGLRDGAGGVDRLVRVGDEFEPLRTEALLANPLLDFDRLLLIKRRGNLGLPQNWQGNCVMRGGFDNEIAVLSPVRPNGELATLYRPQSDGFVGDVDLHWDAQRLLFSMPTENERYAIFEIGVDGARLRQVTPAEPDIDNYDACYLPNRRLCFDQDHDWCPTVTNDGRVMFTRWEYSDTPHYFTRVVMRMNPDGTNQTALYGSNSYWPNSTFYARPIPGQSSKFVGVISGHHGVPRMGELIIFDPALGQHEADGVVQRIPGHGKKVEPIIKDQLVDDSWPRFLHPYPLGEKYFLTACQLNAQSPWGIYLVDVFDNIVPICVQPGVAMLEPVPLRKTQRPRIVPDRIDTRRNDAVVHLTDVYRGGGLAGVPRGTVKQLRLFAFDYGYQDLANHTYIGMEGPWEVHRILGTAEVEADGSAAFRIPANTPIAVQPLDAQGKALQLMRSWFVAMPGETISCVGCHERTTDAPPAKATLAARKSPQAIQPWFGPQRGFSFDREVQPMLDRYCVACHNGDAHDGKELSDLRQDNTPTFSRAYQILQQYVRRPGPESDYHMFAPAEYHADTSPLIQMLVAGHHGVTLPREARERLHTWIDLNVPYFGTWHEFREIPGGQRERRRELRKLHAGIDDDYEEIPQLPTESIQPILPDRAQVAKAVAVECPGWPFDDIEARRRQGDDRERKITLEVAGGGTLELTLVRIPASDFVMGDPAGAADEGPPCRVRFERPFWISKTVITNGQFNLFDPAHDSRYLDREGKDHSNRGTPLNQPGQPVVRVSWDRAMAFCESLTERTGRRFTLPTEAQWEFACRAGVPPGEGGSGRAWGVDAMPGSVAEWTRGDYRPYPYATGDGRNDGARQGRKVVRGAGAINLPETQRDTHRMSYAWWQGIWNVGFRVVCEDDDPTPVVGALAAQEVSAQ